MTAHLRRYFLAGLLVWLPVWVTFTVINFLVKTMDRTVTLLPHQYQPDQLFGMHVPGVGLILSVIIVIITGVIATNYFGKYLVRFGESIITRVPLVRSIYYGVKKGAQTIFSSKGQSFRKVMLVEYPKAGTWGLAFQTSSGEKEMEKKVGEELVNVFVPTTPNPTSGFLIMVPRSKVIELDMSVDDALKMVISLGVVVPGAEEAEEDA